MSSVIHWFGAEYPTLQMNKAAAPFMCLRLRYQCGLVMLIDRISSEAVLWSPFTQLRLHYKCTANVTRW